MNDTYIIIGRDAKTGQLLLSGVGKSGTYGNNVPQDISEQHCRLDFNTESIRLKNLDINNFTYVNGQAVESKTITRKDKIELGSSRFPLPWEAIDAIVPPVADIRPLQQVWDEYERQNVKLQVDERKFNALRSATGLITMVAIALSIATGGRSAWYMLLYALAILISIVFFVKAYRDSSKSPQKRQELSHQFQRDYVCPHCGRFLGNQPYHLLAQNDHCSYCRVNFIH